VTASFAQPSRPAITDRAVFFDRDGVINRVLIHDGKPFSPRNLEEFVFNEGIQEAVPKLKDRGYKIIIITNQPDLARGKISQQTLDSMTQKIRGEIPVDDIFVCPHDDHHECSCRKPKPGLILAAAEKWGLDLSASYFIGDTWKDTEAGRAAGCQTILIDAVYNQDVACDFRVQSLSEAASLILSRQNKLFL
jgi:D-glycero-D-manno-heptose 1,7-bisphosphate phosphatase